MLRQNGITDKPPTTKNPQANSVCERVHQCVDNTLRILSSTQPPAGIQDAEHLVDTALATAMYATRCAYNTSISTTPGGLAFGRDMILNLPLYTDLQLLQENRQQLVDQRLILANRRQFSYDYQPGQEVLKFIHQPAKLVPQAAGPFTIQRVHANGTVTI